MDRQEKVYNFEVVIIGAGAAGIGAAVKLQKQNVPYIILEARNRIGGRVLTKNLDGINVDLGASWIHSYSKKNPLHKYVKQFKVPHTALTKCESARAFVDGQQGGQFDQNTLEVSSINCSYIQRLAKVNASKFQKDVSIFEAVSTYYEQNINKSSPKQKRCTELLLNMIEHYEASTLKQLSVNYYQFRIDEGQNFLPEGGYGSLIMKIAEENKLNVQFYKIVEKIIYDEVKAQIYCRDGSIYKCKKLITSLPIGVLKAKKVKFVPELPLQHSNSIQRLGLGLMNKIIVSFEQNFWGSYHWVLIGSQERGKFAHIYNLSQKGKNILCCFITDDFARKTQNYSDEEIISEFLNFLKKSFKIQNLKMIDYVVTKWGKQQFSLGSYTSFHVGSTPQDCYTLRKPIKDTLWIVGEHCYAEHIGTAHGAFQTGDWAAEQAMSSLKWVNPVFKEPKHIKNKNQKQIQ